MKKLLFKLFLRRKGVWNLYKYQFQISEWRSQDETINDFLRYIVPEYWVSHAFSWNEHFKEWATITFEWNSYLLKSTFKNIALKILKLLGISIVGGIILASLFIVLRTVITGG